MNPVAAAIAAAQAATLAVAGVSVRYRRGNTFTDADPQAVFSRTSLDRVGHDGLTTQEHVEDVLLSASAIVFAGIVSDPDEGDVVERTLGEWIEHHQVLPPSNGGAAWSFRDANHSQVRLHTKLIAREAVDA